ncbi:MAG: glycogen debranching enzyme, partial [Cyanobacteria bacterium J06555_13]
WLNWALSDENKELLRYSQKLVKLIKKHPVFRRRDWFYGREIYGSGIRDIGWFNVDGKLMQDEWTSGYVKTLTVFLNGEEIATPNKWGEQVLDDSFLLMFNAHYEPLEFALPTRFRNSDNTDWPDRKWRLVIDTKSEGFVKRTKTYKKNDKIPVAARSLIVLRSRRLT